MATELTVDETTLDVTVTVSNERGPAGPAGVVEAVEVGDITPVSSGKLIGRHGGGSGAAQEVGLDGGLEFQGANIRREALTGDVTASAGSNATTIADDAVTNTKLANMAEATIKGRASGAGTGDPQDLTAEQVQAIATTAASIDTALQSATAEQDVSIRSSLGIKSAALLEAGQLDEELNRCGRFIINRLQAGTGPITLMNIGDSLGVALWGADGLDQIAWRAGSKTLIAFGGSGRTALGTAADMTTGLGHQIAAGGSSSYSITGGDSGYYRANKISIAYYRYSGGGTITWEFSVDGGTTWQNAGTIDTNNATSDGVYAEVTLTGANANRPLRCRVRNLSGASVRIAGVGAWDARSGGVVGVTFNLGGAPPEVFAGIPAALIQPIFAGWAPDLVTSRWDDGASSWETGGGWVTLYDTLKASAHTAWDVLQFGYGPNNYVAPIDPIIAAQRAWAESTDNGFFDTRFALGGDYTTANALGYMADGVHTNPLGNSKINAAVNSQFAASHYLKQSRGTLEALSSTGASTPRLKPFTPSAHMWQSDGGMRLAGPHARLGLSRLDASNVEDPTGDLIIENRSGAFIFGGSSPSPYDNPGIHVTMDPVGREFFPDIDGLWRLGRTGNRWSQTFTRQLSVGPTSPAAPTLTAIFQGTASLDFPSVAAGGEQTLTIAVTGCTLAKNGSVELGWSAALPAGIIVKQARVSADATVSVTVANITGSPIDPTAVTCRAVVIEF